MNYWMGEWIVSINGYESFYAKGRERNVYGLKLVFVHLFILLTLLVFTDTA